MIFTTTFYFNDLFSSVLSILLLNPSVNIFSHLFFCFNIYMPCIFSETFFKNFIYVFLDRGEGREKEGERHINVWFPLTPPPHWTATQACALTRNQTGNPLVCRPKLNPLNHTSLGSCSIFFICFKSFYFFMLKDSYNHCFKPMRDKLNISAISMLLSAAFLFM